MRTSDWIAGATTDGRVVRHVEDLVGPYAASLKGKAYAVNGTDDHVHMVNKPAAEGCLFVATPCVPIKANSSGWMNSKWKRAFAWQLGYGAFSVQQVQCPRCPTLHREPGTTSSPRHVHEGVC